MPFGCGRPYLQGAPLVGFLCIASISSMFATSQLQTLGRSVLATRPCPKIMSAIWDATAVSGRAAIGPAPEVNPPGTASKRT
jgi:hypothetical protein